MTNTLNARENFRKIPTNTDLMFLASQIERKSTWNIHEYANDEKKKIERKKIESHWIYWVSLAAFRCLPLKKIIMYQNESALK